MSSEKEETIELCKQMLENLRNGFNMLEGMLNAEHEGLQLAAAIYINEVVEAIGDLFTSKCNPNEVIKKWLENRPSTN